MLPAVDSVEPWRRHDRYLHWLAREFGDARFVPLSIRDLESLDTAGTAEHFGTGARLYREDDPADSCFLIRSGTVQLVRERDGDRIGVCEVGEGQVIGDHEMFRGMAHRLTAIARSPVEAIRFSRELTMDALAMHPRVALRWLLSALEKTAAAQDHIAILKSGSVRSRLAAYLAGQGADVVQVTHDELGETIGAERASVTRAIGALRDARIISNSRGTVEILDRARLETVATDPSSIRAPRDDESIGS